ncbi:MAG: hypothetical protein ACTSP4_05525 [Candidatus Hodarchaeales archaeon]
MSNVEKQETEEKQEIEEKTEEPEKPVKFLNKDEIDKLRREIAALEENKSRILERMRIINADKKQYREARDGYNLDSAENFNKVNDIKQKRDSTNLEIKDLKLMREGVLEELKILIEKAKKIRETFDDNVKSTRDSRRLQKTIKDLEWKIQTTPGMSINEERELVQKLEALAEQLDVAEEGENKYREFRDINKQIRDLKGFLDDSWERMQVLVSTSQNRHKSLTELYKAGKTAKEEADKYHKLFIQKAEEFTAKRNELKDINEILNSKYGYLKQNTRERQRFHRATVKARNARIMDQKVKEIQSKLETSKTSRRGLSMEEMRILMDRNIVSLEKKEENDS